MCDESCMKNMNEITAKCSNLGVTESYKQFCVINNEFDIASFKITNYELSYVKLTKVQEDNFREKIKTTN